MKIKEILTKIKIVFSDESLEKFYLSIPEWFGSKLSVKIHTIIFIFSYCLIIIGFNPSSVFDVLTNVVSLEAIYLSLFILMSGNLQLKKLHDVADGVRDIQEDVDEIQEDVKEIQEDVDEIQEDVKEIQDDDEDDEILCKIESNLNELIKEISALKKRKR